MKCLAGAVYFESKGESLEGQLAVARVIINRARSGRFADSLCGVIYQPGQFSFVRGNGMPSIRLGSESWREAVAIRSEEHTSELQSLMRISYAVFCLKTKNK